MIEWLKEHGDVVLWMTIGSVVTLVGSMVVASVVILRIPRDYFAHERRPKRESLGLPAALGLPVRIAKNVIGAVLVVAGAAMLVVPGQGLLTMIVGVFLLDIPGKYRLERWIVSRARVLKALNWFRRKRGREPFEVARKG